MSDQCILGADMGGTKTSLILSEGDRLTSWSGPGVNVTERGPSAAAALLAELLAETLQRTELDGVCIGAAGAGSPSKATELVRHLRALTNIPVERIQVVSDAEAALCGAFSGLGGVVVLAGTGSGCYARDQAGEFRRAGGWGDRIGDPGSGTMLGRWAVRAFLEDRESGFSTELGKDVGAVLSLPVDAPGTADILSVCSAPDFRFSVLAPILLDAAGRNDNRARSLLRKECNELARQCKRLVSSGPSISPKVALIGGLLDEPPYRSELMKALEISIPQFEIVEPEHGPARGAWMIARDAVQNHD